MLHDPNPGTDPRLTWFLSALAAGTIPADIDHRLGADDPATVGLAAWLVLDQSHKVDDAVVSTVALALSGALSGQDNAPCPTWALALWTSVLRLDDRRAAAPRHQDLTARAKNRAYAAHVGGGTLMADSSRRAPDFVTLLAAVPFGLFEPEDLVLVDAVRILADRLDAAPPDASLLIAWYWAEQGSFARSRAVLAKAGDHPFAPLVLRSLARQGQIGARFIGHRPAGNGNRYEPLYEERFPKLVTDSDTVTVFARATPLAAESPVLLWLGDRALPGMIEDGGWRFEIPPHPAGTRVTYRLGFADAPPPSESHSYEVLTRAGSGRFLGVDCAADRLRIRTERAAIEITIPEGRPRIAIRPGAPEPAGDPARSATMAGVAARIGPEGDSVEIAAGPVRLTLWQIGWLSDAAGNVISIEARLGVPAGGIFGLGERYNALDQTGQWIDQFVYNQYKNQGVRTYMPMPVFYSDAGYGLWLATDSYSWFDFARAADGAIRLGAETPQIDLALLLGPVAAQVTQFIDLTGAPRPVPDWALGPWMSSNNWDHQAEVEGQLARAIAHAIPATVLVIEAWSDEATFYIFNDATYPATPGSEALGHDDYAFPAWGRWPDPRGMIDRLHDAGLRLVLWQIPVIKHVHGLDHGQKSRDEAHVIAQGFGVRHPDGTPFRIPEGWFKDSLLLDFTNPAARDWWFAKRRYLLDIGVDGFKTDGGEMVWGHDLVFADGTTGLVNRNRYPGAYIGAYFDFAQRNGGITFSRAGFTGAQTYPAHWAGDERSTWDAFRRSILAGLSAGMSGVIFWSWDMAGFSGEVPGAELYIRSAQMACFCPIMQYHAESKAEFNQDRTPWNIAERSGDPRALDLYAFYARLRMALLPYFVAEAAHCVAARTPLMRAMLLDHPEDPQAVPLWDQYRLGRDLLVAPVITEGATTRPVHLPGGRWWHLLEERWYDGGGAILAQAPLGTIPVFVREGALLPLGFSGDPRFGAPCRVGMADPDALVLVLCAAGEADGVYQRGDLSIAVRRDQTGAVICAIHGKMPTIWIVFSDPPRAVVVNGKQATPVRFRLHERDLLAVRWTQPEPDGRDGLS